MVVLRPDFDIEAFRTSLVSADERVLMLDYDGTLAPFTLHRDRALPYKGVRERLEVLHGQKQTRLVLISGRTAPDLVRLLDMDPCPEIWGSHGWERFRDGRYDAPMVPEQWRHALTEARDACLSIAGEDRCEFKPASVAVHWRGQENGLREDVERKLLPLWTGIASRLKLELQQFDGGMELRCPGRDKGASVRTILSESPPGAVAAYLGDDRTDEDAFAAIRGRGVAVLVRKELRDTNADLWLTPPEELLEFMDLWIN